MINTEVCLFVKRTETELEHIHNKLRVLMALAEDNGIADCIDTAENMVNDVRNTAKDAAKQIDSIGGSLWSRMYHLEQEQGKAAKAAAEAEAAKATTTIVVKGKDAAEQAHLNDALNAQDKSREANAAAIQSAPSAECKGCGCDSAAEAEGGELNG